MLKFLDTNSQRINALLLMMKDDVRWRSTKHLADTLNVSHRTIAQDITQMKSMWGHLFIIETSTQFGVRIKNLSSHDYETILFALVRESLSINFIELLFVEPFKSLDDYAEKLFTSKSTLIRTIPRINEIIKVHSIMITSKQGLYSFTSSNEPHLRKYFTRLFTDLYGTRYEFFPLEFDFELIKKLTASILEQQKLIVNSISYSLFFYSVLVSLVRENQGFKFTTQDEFKPLDPTTLKRIHHSFINVNDESIQSIIEIIQEYRINLDSCDEHVIFDQAFSDLCTAIESHYRIIVNEDNRKALKVSLSNIYFKFHTYPFKASLSFDKVRHYAQSIYRQHPLAITHLKLLIKSFTLKISVDYELMVWDCIYWIVAQIPEIIANTHQRVNALYISDLSQEHANLIARVLDIHFGSNRILVDVAHVNDHYELDGYDLIITPLNNLKESSIKTIVIHDYPNDDDLFNIYQEVKNAQKKDEP